MQPQAPNPDRIGGSLAHRDNNERNVLAASPVANLVPNPGDGRLTLGASAITQPVLPNTEAVTFNEESIAVRAVGVFPTANMPREIPGIYVPKSGRSTNFASANKRADGCVVWLGHPVIFMERRHMPGNVGRNAGEKSSDVTELFAGVVEARNNQRHNFQPEAFLMKLLNRVQHTVEAATEFSIISVAKALQIHLIQIDPGAQIVDYFRRSIPIRDVGRLESLPPCFAEDFHGPLAGDERLVVGAGDNSGLMAAGEVNEIAGRQIARRGSGIGIAQGL